MDVPSESGLGHPRYLCVHEPVDVPYSLPHDILVVHIAVAATLTELTTRGLYIEAALLLYQIKLDKGLSLGTRMAVPKDMQYISMSLDVPPPEVPLYYLCYIGAILFGDVGGYRGE